jgi:hypothetical protein
MKIRFLDHNEDLDSETASELTVRQVGLKLAKKIAERSERNVTISDNKINEVNAWLDDVIYRRERRELQAYIDNWADQKENLGKSFKRGSALAYAMRGGYITKIPLSLRELLERHTAFITKSDYYFSLKAMAEILDIATIDELAIKYLEKPCVD